MKLLLQQIKYNHITMPLIKQSQLIHAFVLNKSIHNYKLLVELKFSHHPSDCPKMNLIHNDHDFQILLPNPTIELAQLFSQLSMFSKQRLDTDDNAEGPLSQQQIKGLKFISSKLAKLFSKNRQLPYNEISKILIDNFAHEQKDQRNIKRRVYDAINVLVSAGILVKKNNSIEMIKNKIRAKIQYDKKDKIQDQIKEKQDLLDQKRQQHMDLVHKHKLIKKLFDRNVKNSSIRQSMLKKTKTRSDGLKGMSQSRVLASSNALVPVQNFIYEPRVLIFTAENIGSRKVQKSLLRNFQNQNQLQIMVPFKKSIFQPIILETGIPTKNKNYVNQMDEQLHDDRFIPQNDGSDEKVNRFISDYGIYSLLDLLELLSLNENMANLE